MDLPKFKLLSLPSQVDPKVQREYHDKILTGTLRDLYLKLLKYSHRNHPTAQLQAKVYFEMHFPQIENLLREELDKSQTEGFYFLSKKFLNSANSYLEQHLNPEKKIAFLKDFKELIEHMEHYTRV